MLLTVGNGMRQGVDLWARRLSRLPGPTRPYKTNSILDICRSRIKRNRRSNFLALQLSKGGNRDLWSLSTMNKPQFEKAKKLLGKSEARILTDEDRYLVPIR